MPDRLAHGLRRHAPDLATHITRLMTNSNPAPPALPGAGIRRSTRSERGRTYVAESSTAANLRRRLNKIKASVAASQGPSTSSPTLRRLEEVQASGRCAAGASRSGGAFGHVFGQFGEGYLRFSVANSLENLQLALDRLDK